jgi:hypothetical protein
LPSTSSGSGTIFSGNHLKSLSKVPKIEKKENPPYLSFVKKKGGIAPQRGVPPFNKEGVGGIFCFGNSLKDKLFSKSRTPMRQSICLCNWIYEDKIGT